MDIKGWDSESSRSVANVTWFSGSTNVYRLGHKGNCDLKYIESASGGCYYPEHLPVLGNVIRLIYFLIIIVYVLGQSSEQDVRAVRSGPPQYTVGDKVQVAVSIEQLKTLQQGHGGWNPRMAEVGCSY